MDTPPGMRGRNYPTIRNARCQDYHGCEVCRGCTMFNRLALRCTHCEEIKPMAAICHHSDAQQVTVIRLTELTKMPMNHIDARAVDVNIPIAGNSDYEDIIAGAMSGPGSLSALSEAAA